MIVTMVANCTVSYSGRTGSDMGEGERLVILKGDGCVLVHRSRDYQPSNWQPAGAAAVKQLVEYLKYLSPAEGKKLRPIIVAPSLAKGVLPTVEKMKIEFKPLTLQKSLETLQKRMKSDQKALKGWLGDSPSERS